MLTAISLSYGKAKIRPHRLKNPDPIKTKFGTVDYVGGGNRQTKFHANPPEGASPRMGEMYAEFFIVIYTVVHKNVPLFLNSSVHNWPILIFWRATSGRNSTQMTILVVTSL